MEELKTNSELKFEVGGVTIHLEEGDLLIEQTKQEGFEAVSDKGLTVVIDTKLTEGLLEEGFVREVISKIQTMRKEADFEVTDKIKVYYANNAKVAKVVGENGDTIAEETLALSIEEGVAEGYAKNWKINGELVDMVVVKA